MAKTFPYPGQLMDVAPFNQKMMRVTVGPTSDYDVAVTSTGNYNLLNIGAGTVITDVLISITADFGGTAAITVGDCDAINGFFTDTVIVSSAVSNTCKKSSLLSMTYSGGRQYTAADIVKLNLSGAANTVGAADIFVIASRAGTDSN